MGTIHPRLHNRTVQEERLSPGDVVRVLVYAPKRAAALEAAIADKTVLVQIAHSVDHVVSALIEDPPPRPQILLADFDDLGAGEIMHLHVLREQGWFGRIIALGDVPPALRASLDVERVITPPLARDALREVIRNAGFAGPTTKLPVF